eukprot:103042-Chlamydomonas_euryale.AAC.6
MQDDLIKMRQAAAQVRQQRTPCCERWQWTRKRASSATPSGMALAARAVLLRRCSLRRLIAFVPRGRSWLRCAIVCCVGWLAVVLIHSPAVHGLGRSKFPRNSLRSAVPTFAGEALPRPIFAKRGGDGERPTAGAMRCPWYALNATTQCGAVAMLGKPQRNCVS